MWALEAAVSSCRPGSSAPSPGGAAGCTGLSCRSSRFLISAGWLGLMLWCVDSLRRRCYDLAVLSLVPLVVIFAHSFFLLWNTQFAFPCEALALGLGLPAGLSVALRRLAPPSRSEARPTSAP